jgi:hypothetical protein
MKPLEIMVEAFLNATSDAERIDEMLPSELENGMREALRAVAGLDLEEGELVPFLHARTTIPGTAPGHVVDDIHAPDDDPALYRDCGLDAPSGNPVMRNSEEFEYKTHVVRCGLKAWLIATADTNL